jgi:hypothetical protein
VKAAAVALLSFTLAGCAPAAPAASPRTPAPPAVPVSPVSQWEDGTDDDLAETEPEEADLDGLSDAPPLPPTASQASPAGESGSEQFMLGGLDPEVIHRARIEMARAALVEENANKERVDLAEELQRELAALEATTQSSKSRVKHGGPAKKQP